MWNPFVKNAQSVKTSNQSAQAATQLHLQIAEIRDSTVVLKNGGLRAVVQCSAINFNLKSEAEQNAIIYSYQSFLNTLDFPIQIVVRSRKLDLDTYLVKLRKIAEKQTNTLLQKQTYDYIDYIQRLIEYADIMQKQFYVVIPTDSNPDRGKNFVQKFWERMHPADNLAEIMKRHRQFDTLKKGLVQKLNVVTSGLENCGLKVSPLNTEELIQLYYQIYNPLTSRNQKAENLDELKIASDQSIGRG